MERKYYSISELPYGPEYVTSKHCWYLPDIVKDDSSIDNRFKSVLVYRNGSLFKKAKYLSCLFFYVEDSKCYEFFTGIFLGYLRLEAPGYGYDKVLEIRSEEFGSFPGSFKGRSTVNFREDIQPYIADKEIIVQRIKDMLNKRSQAVIDSHRKEQEKQRENDTALREADEYLKAIGGAPKGG